MEFNNKLQKVIEAGLYEYGFYTESLKDKWESYLDRSTASRKKFIIACNNSDHTLIALKELKTALPEFIKGIKAVCESFNIKNVKFYIPEYLTGKYETELNNLTEQLNYLEVVEARVDVLEINDGDLVHHVETVTNIGRVISGKDPLVYIKVIAGDVEKDIQAAMDSKIANIVKSAGFSIEDDMKVIVGGVNGEKISLSDTTRTMLGYGNSSIEIINEPFCVVQYAEKCMEQAYKDSCGKCTFCREGSYQLWNYLKNAISGYGKAEDIKIIKEISDAVSEQSICSQGEESVRFLKNSLITDSKEYKEHIRVKKCRNDVCQDFIDIAVDGGKCNGCGKCINVCDANAIEGKEGYIHVIDVFECTKCGRCITACPQDAVRKVRAGREIGPERPLKVEFYRSSRRRYYS